MVSPQRLLEAFEASKNEDTKKKNAVGNDDSNNNELVNPTNNSVSTPTKTAPQQTNNNDMVSPYESPIGKYLPRPMGMAKTTSQEEQKISFGRKRVGYLGWDDYFLGIAVLSSQRSKDPIDAEGACIADAANRIVAIGYSGFPRGCPDTIFPWKDYDDDEVNKSSDNNNNKNNDNDNDNADTLLHSKRPYLCTAATNAVLNKGSQDLAGCRLYVTTYPTSECVKVMIQSGIQELIILGEGEDEDERNASDDMMMSTTVSATATEDKQASHIMLTMANIRVRYYRPPMPSITLDFGTDGVVSPTLAESQSSPPTSTTGTIGTLTDEELQAATILKEETDYDALLVGIGNNGRRKEYLSWDDYFMSVAFLTAQRSKDPNTQVGACIVDDQRRIVGLGYNGMPRGLSDDDMPWERQNSNNLFNKYLYVTHAEVNAILNSNGSYGSHVNGGTIYVALFPCENCAKMIIQSGIKKVVYLKDVYHDTDGCRASRVMLRCAKIELQQYHPTMSQMDVEYYPQEGGDDDDDDE